MHCDESWPSYEANLQAYRTDFLLSQTMMLIVGAIVAGQSLFLLLAAAVISVFQILYVWMPVIYYRALLVDFHKYGLGERFDDCGEPAGEGSPCRLTESAYCKNTEIRKKVNRYLGEETAGKKPFRNRRKTRRKLDIVLPVSMMLVWVFYLLRALI